MANFNKTEDYTFAKLCNTFTSFEIPNFQRPYAWTNKNLQDFWSSIIENEENYFIGNVVAVDSTPLKIIDGQQRLTTISLLLCALRDSYIELSPGNKYDEQLIQQRKDEINLYLFWDDLDEVPKITYKRLKLGKKIYQDVFEKIIDNRIDEINLKEIGDNERRILNNYKILKTFIKKFIKNLEITRLDEIKNKILKLQVITIVCDSDNDIYGIFEGFNSTGLGLSVADLIKNALLKFSSTDKIKSENIESQWGELEELFEETSTAKFPKFLRYQWISENGYVSMSGLYEKIKLNKMKSIDDIEIYVNKIFDDGKTYIGMVYDKKSNLLNIPKNIKKEIFEFRYLRNEQVYEILLSWCRLYKNNLLKEVFLIESLKRLWTFAVRAKFVSINPSDYEKIFSNHCGDIAKSNKPEENIKVLFEKLKPLVNNKKQFTDNILLDVKYGRDNKLISKLYIDLMNQDNPEIVQSKPEIEHILPQSPNKWGLEKIDIKDYVNKIGNLTLLFGEYNREIGNEKIDIKKEIFKKSSFKLNNNIDNNWAELFKKDYKKAIIDRGREMVERIEVIWSI